jgi:hypothetical protein
MEESSLTVIIYFIKKYPRLSVHEHHVRNLAHL